jgi:multidrug efflux pump subunit AcrA (membrane-fusion protein)
MYYDSMQRYRQDLGVGGVLDWIFTPGAAAGQQMADAEKAAAEAAIAQTGKTAELEARLKAAEAQLAALKAQPVRAGVNWLAVGALGLGAYFLFFRKKR